ncbi:unnamed protein product, partial [Vitis vinifera]
MCEIYTIVMVGPSGVHQSYRTIQLWWPPLYLQSASFHIFCYLLSETTPFFFSIPPSLLMERNSRYRIISAILNLNFWNEIF